MTKTLYDAAMNMAYDNDIPQNIAARRYGAWLARKLQGNEQVRLIAANEACKQLTEDEFDELTMGDQDEWPGIYARLRAHGYDGDGLHKHLEDLFMVICED